MSRLQQLTFKPGLRLLMAGSLACFASTAQAITEEEANQIDEGFRLFTEETFEGNGRTCATCHIPEANYTIGPRDIARLRPADLDLVLARNVPGLENETLVRRLGLFNIGPGDANAAEPEGPFRGSMGVHALDLTIFNNFPEPPPANPPVNPATIDLGWSSDGSPSGGFHHGNPDPDADGSIRAFANGAIAQHNPKTLNRVAGVDFRFATADELDALEAFQRWLGRRAAPGTNPRIARYEFDLAQLTFTDPRVEEGKDLFMSEEASCNTCHANGGGNFNLTRLQPLLPPPGQFPPFIVGANARQHTGAEDDRERLSARVGIEIPFDEGIEVDGIPAAFNLQTVIESPRKHAFFHNSAVVGGVEDAAQFYFRPPFARTNGQPGTGAINREALEAIAPGGHLDSVEAFRAFAGFDGFNKLGAFMRSLSVYYALVDCQRLLTEAVERIDIGVSPKVPADHCIFNLNDVSQVLNGARLSPLPYQPAIGNSQFLAGDIRTAIQRQDRTAFQDFVRVLDDVRRFIATTPQLP